MSDEIRRAFAPVAANYLTSPFHGGAVWLEEVVELARPEPSQVVLDVATGTGHAALALAPLVARVTGLDLTPEMLEQARRLAESRGIDNVEWIVGDAHALPFPDSSFDIWMARAAPHHFDDLGGAIREAHRVLRPGGSVVIIDGSGPVEARDHMHQIEVLRDPTHRLMYTLEEWQAILARANLDVETARLRRMDQDFEAWIARIGFPVAQVEELAAIVESSSGPARQQLRPRRRHGRLWHSYWHALIRAVKPVGTPR